MTCNATIGGINTLPECLQDILLNSLSSLRSGMWMENGRWRQWEAFDCANMDPVHVDFHRIIPYVIMFPGMSLECYCLLRLTNSELRNEFEVRKKDCRFNPCLSYSMWLIFLYEILI